jgi:replication initiation protein RepC
MKAAETVFPLGMVLDACPDITDYAKGGIANWRDFVATAMLVRPMLGVSASAWEEAVDVMGERQAATVVAAILQRGEAIVSAGGYLRDLTRKAVAGQFTLGPMLMALIGRRKREKRRA